MNEAIQKINEEMQKHPENQYMEILGHYIIDRCDNEIVSARVAAKGKSLGGAMSAVLQIAQKKKVGNAAVLMPGEVFAAVDQYFGIPEDRAAQAAAMNSVTAAVPQPAHAPAVKPSTLNLEDFL